MALPFGPYEGQDLTSYEEGNKFLPREFYSLGFPNTPPPSIANASTGITNTNIAQPFIWPPQGGGGDFKGGGKYGHLDMSKTKDFVKNVYVDQGPKKGWQKQTVKGYYDTNTGNWKTIDNRNINHAGLQVTGLFTGLMNKISGKQFGVPQVGDIQGTFTKDPSGDIEEEEAIYNAAIHRNRINKIIRTGIYKDDYVPTGGDRHPDDPTGDGGYTPGDNTINWDSGVTGTTDFHPSQGNTQPHGTDTSGDFAGKGSGNPFGRAQGGRIGYATQGFVDPEEPAENIFNFMQDQNIPFGEQVEGEEGILEQLIAQYIEAGFPPDQAEEMAMREFQAMSQGSEQGIASLV